MDLVTASTNLGVLGEKEHVKGNAHGPDVGFKSVVANVVLLPLGSHEVGGALHLLCTIIDLRNFMLIHYAHSMPYHNLRAILS